MFMKWVLACVVLLTVSVATAGTFKVNFGGGPSRKGIGVSAESILTVRGIGVGTSRKEALKDAYRSAVEKAVGLYVDAEAEAKNDEIIKDQILTYSNAYVKSYDVEGERAVNGNLIEITILAKVVSAPFVERLREVMPGVKINIARAMRDSHAQLISTTKRSEDALALLKNELGSFDPITKLVKVDVAGEPKVIPDAEDVDSVRIWIPLSFAVEKDKYAAFVESFCRVLKEIAQESKLLQTKSVPSKVHRDYCAQKTSRFDVNAYQKLDGYLESERLERENRRGNWSSRLGVWQSPIIRTSTLEGVLLMFSRYDYIDVYGTGREAPGVEFGFSKDWSYLLKHGRLKYFVGVDGPTSSSAMNVFVLDNNCISYMVQWQASLTEPNFALELIDKEGRTIAQDTVKVEKNDLLNSAYVEQMTGCRSGTGHRILVHWFSSRVGCAGETYHKWFSVKVAKDVLTEIETIKVENAKD